jgi:hypothetical protein
MLTFHFGGALRVPGSLALKQDLSRYPFSQAEQRLDRDAGCLLLRQLSAIDRIEHPARDGDLFTIVQPNDVDLLREAAQSADQFDFRAVARMIPVFNSARRQRMCSMRRR